MDAQEAFRFGLSDRGERYHYILDTKSKTSRLGGFPGRDEEERYGRCTLIQKAECPQRDDIQVAVLNVVLHHECILNSLSIYLSFTNDIKY